MTYQPQPGTMLYGNLLSDIETGRIKVPQFQRKFVWSREDTAGLIDSILKGYPIGTFIIWETDERLRSVRNLGGAKGLLLRMKIIYLLIILIFSLI